MDIIKDWKTIKRLVNQGFKTNLHVAIASVDANNQPTITPVGSLFMNNDQSGFYFEKYISRLPLNATTNPNICILAVNSSRWFWFKSLFNSKFKSNPAVRLYGTLGPKRLATDEEINRLKRRMRSTKRLKGHQYLWGNMQMVREIHFTKAKAVKLGVMTAVVSNVY